MRIYIIGNDGITLCGEPPAVVNEGEIVVASNAELQAAQLSGKRLLALWNALPGVEGRPPGRGSPGLHKPRISSGARKVGDSRVGPVTSLAYMATVDDPGRFGTSKALGAHLGLTPRVYQSGEIDRSGQISKCGDRMLRHLLYEAASALMTRTRKWSRLRAWGVAVAKRRGMKRATVAVARKLAVIMHRIWVTGDEFDFGGPAVAAKAA